jgi:serine/threonine-protein kinase
MTTPPKPYRRIGKFELHVLIGEGAMGVVWKAYDTVLRRYVALKLLNTKVGTMKDAGERFLREARAAAAIQHPNIVTVYDLGETAHQLYIAMELAEGRDLSDIIALQEPLALERKLDIVIELLEGLHYAHQRGVIHRDIKPSNVRIQPNGGVKIMDFGIARLQSADATGSGAIVGTPTYMAPEQITNGPITPATDVFAAGCLLYELLTFQKPFEAESVHGVLYQVLTHDPKPLRTMAPSIPAALERVVMKAMNKVPQDRYESAHAMQQGLVGIRAALSGATDHTTQQLSPRWTPFPTAVLKLVTHASIRSRVIVLGLLAVVVALLAYGSRNSPTAEAPAAAAPTTVGAPEPPPTILNPAVASLRDSALAARSRAERAGAMKNNVPAIAIAEAMLQTSDGALRNGDQPRATSGYQGAIGQYHRAVQETQALRTDVLKLRDRATTVARALGTGPDAARAAVSLARADSLIGAKDYTLARLAAQDAEQIAVAAGVAPPSPQPAGAREAIAVLLEDLGRAVASERASNLKALYPTINPAEVRGWQAFFRSADRINARFTVDLQTLWVRGEQAGGPVSAIYHYVPQGGGTQREDRPNFTMRFQKTATGWRIARVTELR